MTENLSYFPGCSLATTAKENNASMATFLASFGVELKELADWNCCGSSSAHSVDSGLALALASRNLFLCPENHSLLVACPGCFQRLWQARKTLQMDAEKRRILERHFQRPFGKGPELVHFFELLASLSDRFSGLKGRLRGLRIVPYYGCMLSGPPGLNREFRHHGLMEKTLSLLGGVPVFWPYASRCCGTFLSASRPKVASDLVNRIMAGAAQADADCVVTACAMCHLNLEMRCRQENRIPVFHFSELLSLALNGRMPKDWMQRHLIDPVPLLVEKGFPI